MRNDIQNIEDQTIKSEENRPITFLTFVFFLTWMALIWFCWNAWSSYQTTQTDKEYDFKIEKLRGTIVHLDEVLTMSARMAAASGNLQWEKRYRSFEPKLDAAIKEAMRLAPEAYSDKAAADTNAANIRLVEMENHSFDLVRQGRLGEAKTLLFSDEYEEQKRIYAQGMTNFAKHKDLYMRLEELRGTIVHLDEVLTMSARMAAATGNLQWEKRYRSFEPKLDAAIKEAMRLAPEAYSDKAAADTNAANIRLVEMENHSFDLVRQGRLGEAKTLLFSDEYEEQKRIYAQGMINFAANISIIINTGMKDEQRQAFLHVGIVFLLTFLLIIVWFVALRVELSWKKTFIGKKELEKEIVERKKVEEALREKTNDLGERVKELNCLYGISNLLEKPDISLEELFQGVVDLIPPSWQYPEITCARIIVNAQEYRTDNFRKTTLKQASDINVDDDRVGIVEVYYLEERPKLDAGPFLEEERNLINAIADRLGHIIEQKQIEEALRKSEERLRLLVESSKDMITLQRSDGTFLYYNGPSVYSIRSEDVLGKTPYDLFEKEEADRMVDQIEEIFQSGGSGYFESLLDWQGKKGWFSEYIYPIFDSDGHVEAVAKICSDITERKLTEEEREKLIHELQNALAEVKTLSGLLPICAHCKNIRDDKGYWNKIENYIHQHSGTQFSHGICPECTKKYYPDIDLNDDSE